MYMEYSIEFYRGHENYILDTCVRMLLRLLLGMLPSRSICLITSAVPSLPLPSPPSPPLPPLPSPPLPSPPLPSPPLPSPPLPSPPLPLLQFPVEFASGDLGDEQQDYRLPNSVFNTLRQHSYKEQKQVGFVGRGGEGRGGEGRGGEGRGEGGEGRGGEGRGGEGRGGEGRGGEGRGGDITSHTAVSYKGNKQFRSKIDLLLVLYLLHYSKIFLLCSTKF